MKSEKDRKPRNGDMKDNVEEKIERKPIVR